MQVSGRCLEAGSHGPCRPSHLKDVWRLCPPDPWPEASQQVSQLWQVRAAIGCLDPDMACCICWTGDCSMLLQQACVTDLSCLAWGSAHPLCTEICSSLAFVRASADDV